MGNAPHWGQREGILGGYPPTYCAGLWVIVPNLVKSPVLTAQRRADIIRMQPFTFSPVMGEGHLNSR